MCGIAGWVDYIRNLTLETHTICDMTEALSHRGPDASGVWQSENVLLGHRRLAVVDVLGGVQPMTRTIDGRTCAIVYNGELYNTISLRKELFDYGIKFYTDSDTEVLLMAYMKWGESCLDKLNGIFAFAVWEETQDGKNKKLFLVRDRFGVKPLFYAIRGESLIFSSELPSLMKNRLIKPVINKEGISELLVMSPCRTPGIGIVKDVNELKPGHCLSYTKDELNEYCYWKLESKPHEDDLELTLEKVRWLFIDTVKRQLVSDVPIGTFLSGGLDSSAITAIAAEVFKKSGKGPLDTFSLDFEGNDKFFKSGSFQPDADKPWVDIVSGILGTNHKYTEINNLQMADELRPALRYRGLPGMADVDSSLLMFCRNIKKTHTVALSGECADEVFGGYPWFYRKELLESNTFPWMINNSVRNRVLSPELLDVLRPEEYLSRRYEEGLDMVPTLPGENEEDAKRRSIFYLNIYWFMANLLERKDRMSMGCGLEVRVPFADHRLVQYVWNIPWDMKMLNGREKGLLRQALRGILPDNVIDRKKSPYPKTHNPAYEERVKKMLLDVINDSASPIKDYINKKEIEKMLNEPSDYVKPWFGQLMSKPQLYAWLIQVDEWFRYLNISTKLD